MRSHCSVNPVRACLGLRRKWRVSFSTDWQRILSGFLVAVVILLYSFGAFREWILICQGHQAKSVVFKWQLQRESLGRRRKELAIGAQRSSSVNDRLLCWIMTSPDTLKQKASAVRDTWAQLCDMSLFMSSKEDLDFPAVGLKVPENYGLLWLKAREAWLHVYDRYLEEFEWFLKADDDTYVVVDNLRRFLQRYDPARPHYFGQRMHEHANKRWWCEDDYNSGGAGYVVSRKALHQLGPVLQDDSLCSGHHSGEDVQFSLCLKAAGVDHPGDTRDDQFRQRFHLFSFQKHAFDLLPLWVQKRVFDWKPVGKNCCSRETVSLHYVDPVEMRRTHYLLHCIWSNRRHSQTNNTSTFCKHYSSMYNTKMQGAS